MPNQSNGLRFDVYERVHLPEEVAAIDELEEIELVPRIQIVQQGEQVMLKGHLLLTGIYRAEDGPDAEQALEHWIPVEITLPMNRIHRLDDISVEIDNFDVDVLSARTLNITGVLSLLGIELDQPRDQDAWPREEPFTVVHKREEEQNRWETQAVTDSGSGSSSGLSDQLEKAANPYPSESWSAEESITFGEILDRQEEAAKLEREAEDHVTAEREAKELEAQLRQVQQSELEARLEKTQKSGVDEKDKEEALDHDSVARAALARENQLIAEARQEALNQESLIKRERSLREQELRAEAAEANRIAEQQLLYQEEQNAAEAGALPQAVQPFDAQLVHSGEHAAVESESERKEMKIALSSKRVEEEKEPSAGGIGFRSLLQSSKREQEARAAAEQIAEREAAEARKSTGDDIEWKNLFYGRSNDDQSFRKLKLCIVQREETLEAIAGRYQLQPREIILYNRLADQSVSEGQVLYIP